MSTKADTDCSKCGEPMPIVPRSNSAWLNSATFTDALLEQLAKEQ